MTVIIDGTNGVQSVSGSATLASITNINDTNTGVFFPASETVALATAGSERLRIDASGNAGLGVTPSAWGSGWAGSNSKVLEISAVGNWVGAGPAATALGANVYYDSSNVAKYATSSLALTYVQNSGTGAHTWSVAPSGTAGNTITFTQAMTLTTLGDLLIGTTGGGTALTVVARANAPVASFDSPSAGYAYMALRYNGTAYGYFGQASAMLSGASNTDLAIRSENALLFASGGGTERARITAGGEVYIAGTTDQGAYNLQVNGTGVWGAGAYVNGSDERLKDNIQSLDSGLDIVNAMRPVTFQYKPEHSKDQSVQPGFIAQELQQAMAGKAYLDGVVQAGPEYLNVAYQNIIPILTKAIQELKAELDATKARLAAAGL